MYDKFVYESTKNCSFNIAITRECIDNYAGRVNRSACRNLLISALHDKAWGKPPSRTPIKLDIEIYFPVVNGTSQWFKQAAKKSFVPCVTEFGIDFIEDVIYPALMLNDMIVNYNQIYSLSYSSTYSIRPRIKITIEKMFQNIGDVREAVRKAKKSESDKKIT